MTVKRGASSSQMMRFFIAFPAYRGLSLDFENIPDRCGPGYLTFIRALYTTCIRAICAWTVNMGGGPETLT